MKTVLYWAALIVASQLILISVCRILGDLTVVPR